MKAFDAMLKFDHLGVVVGSLSAGRDHFHQLFGIERWTGEFDDHINNVWVQFGYDQTGMCYELVAPRNEQSPVYRALKVGAPILNHVAYLAAELAIEVSRLRQLGCIQIGDPKPAIAYGGKRIQFFMSPYRFMFELIEAPDHTHRCAPGT